MDISRLVMPLAAAILLGCVPATALAQADGLAPAVVRKPSSRRDPMPPAQVTPASNGSAAPQTSASPSPCGTASAAACQADTKGSGGNPEQFFALLAEANAESGGDPALDRGLLTTMSRLMAAGRCPDATLLATRSDRAPLAARAQKICQEQ